MAKQGSDGEGGGERGEGGGHSSLLVVRYVLPFKVGFSGLLLRNRV